MIASKRPYLCPPIKKSMDTTNILSLKYFILYGTGKLVDCSSYAEFNIFNHSIRVYQYFQTLSLMGLSKCVAIIAIV